MLNYHICPFGDYALKNKFPEMSCIARRGKLVRECGRGNPSIRQEISSTLFFVSQRQGKMAQQANLHIGQLVKAVFDKSGMSVAQFARQINCERTNVYTIFRRRTIDVELLVRISYILEHNFLDDVMQLTGLRAKFSPSLNLNISFDNRTADETKKVMKQLESIVANLSNSEK
jgi:hypothetical protein